MASATLAARVYGDFADCPGQRMQIDADSVVRREREGLAGPGAGACRAVHLDSGGERLACLAWLVARLHHAPISTQAGTH